MRDGSVLESGESKSKLWNGYVIPLSFQDPIFRGKFMCLNIWKRHCTIDCNPNLLSHFTTNRTKTDEYS